MRVICGSAWSNMPANREKEEKSAMDKSSRENYLVRIYRRDKEDPERIAGMVEFIEAGEKKTFATFDDLRTILARDQDTKRRKTSEQDEGKWIN
jgi:hypothetical protein